MVEETSQHDSHTQNLRTDGQICKEPTYKRKRKTDHPFRYAHLKNLWALSTQASLAPFIQWLLVKVWKESAWYSSMAHQLHEKINISKSIAFEVKKSFRYENIDG